ncbi:MAG: hypothetical protein AB8H47_27035 [Bacteroidia bacterium]
MKTQAQYYQQHQALTDEALIDAFRGLNAYLTVRENGFDGPTRADAADEKRALEQLLEERGLEKPEMVFGDIFRLEVPSDADIPESERGGRLFEDAKPGQKSDFFGDTKAGKKSAFFEGEVDIEKEFRTKGIIQIIVGVILTFFGVGLSLDMKGFLFYGAIFGGLALIVVGILNISSYQKLKK